MPLTLGTNIKHSVTVVHKLMHIDTMVYLSLIDAVPDKAYVQIIPTADNAPTL